MPRAVRFRPELAFLWRGGSFALQVSWLRAWDSSQIPSTRRRRPPQSGNSRSRWLRAPQPQPYRSKYWRSNGLCARYAAVCIPRHHLLFGLARATTAAPEKWRGPQRAGQHRQDSRYRRSGFGGQARVWCFCPVRFRLERAFFEVEGEHPPAITRRSSAVMHPASLTGVESATSAQAGASGRRMETDMRRGIAASTACRDGCAIRPVASTTSGSDSPRGSCGDRGRRAVIASIESQMARASGASPGDCATAMPRSFSSCVLRLLSVVMLSASGAMRVGPDSLAPSPALHQWPVANDVGDPPAQDDVALFNRMRMQGRPAVRLVSVSTNDRRSNP